MATPQSKYVAFISYSHADEAWGRWLHKALEGYRVPARLVGQESPVGPIPSKLFPVFRDRDELATAHELGSEIEKALAESASLIVICSPRAATSRWVNEEVRRYKALGRVDRVFCLIVDGEPGDAGRECFPDAVRFQVDADGTIIDRPAEPIAADVRAGKDTRPDAKLKLIAGVLGIGFNDLKQRELAARNRRLTALASVAIGVSAVTIGLAVLATQARNDAHAQRQIVEARQQQAEGLIQFMIGDLREKLEPIGKLDVLASVGDKALDYFSSIDASQLSESELVSQARAVRQIAEVRIFQGDLEGARTALQSVLPLNKELRVRNPDDPDIWLDAGATMEVMAHALYSAGEYQQSLTWNERRAALVGQALARWPDHVGLRAAQADTWLQAGGVHAVQQNWDIAESNLREAEATFRALLAEVDDESDREVADEALADALSWLSYQYLTQERFADAESVSTELLSRQRAALAQAPDDRGVRERQLVEALLHLVYLRVASQSLQPDDAELAEVLALTRSRVENDPTNAHTLQHLDDALNHQAVALGLAGRHGDSLHAALEGFEVAWHQRELAPDDFDANVGVFQAAEHLAMRAWLAQSPVRVHEAMLRALRAVESTGDVIQDIRPIIARRLNVYAWLAGLDPADIPNGRAIRAAYRTPAGRQSLRGESGLIAAVLLDREDLVHEAWVKLDDKFRRRVFVQRFCEHHGGCVD